MVLPVILSKELRNGTLFWLTTMYRLPVVSFDFFHKQKCSKKWCMVALRFWTISSRVRFFWKFIAENVLNKPNSYNMNHILCQSFDFFFDNIVKNVLSVNVTAPRQIFMYKIRHQINLKKPLPERKPVRRNVSQKWVHQDSWSTIKTRHKSVGETIAVVSLKKTATSSTSLLNC